MITYLKPDILECLRKGISHIMKRALESIPMNKASGGDGIPAELFQILQDDVVMMFAALDVSKLRKLSSDWKSQVSFQYQRRQYLKNVQILHS